MSTHALASLTANYTDSEPEGEEHDGEDMAMLQDEKKSPADDDEDEEEEVDPLEPVPMKPPSPVPIQVSLEPTSRVTQLVSYHDDTVISDEEPDIPDTKEDSPDSLTKDGVELPAEPTGRCSPRLLDKVQKLYERLESGLDMNNTIESRKDFRNPSIYEKLIQFCNLNELGTNYPARIFDPLRWGKESYYEELAKVQKVEMDKREKEKKERTKVEFVSGTRRTATSEDDLKKRKSKWDQVGAGAGGGQMLGMIRPAGLLQPSLTSSATGTKSTVISAFGSLPKKPKL